jgi:hypothetical protein
MEELEFYPSSRTVDILDCLGYLLKIAKPKSVEVKPDVHNPFLMATIEKELKSRASSLVSYPFDYQLSAWRGDKDGV